MRPTLPAALLLLAGGGVAGHAVDAGRVRDIRFARR
jgi:hypothetical protein